MVDLLYLTILAWAAAAIAGLIPRLRELARALIVIGLIASLVMSLVDLASAKQLTSALSLAPLGGSSGFMMTGAALWLFFFGAIGALAAVLARSPLPHAGPWYTGIALSLLGAIGVFGVQDAVGFLIAWEIMSFGGAVMLLAEQPTRESAQPTLLMLGLLEVGSIALVAAVLWFAAAAGGTGIDAFAGALHHWQALGAGILVLVGFGAKLGLLPFYEWYPDAYLTGSGASGVILSGVVLNAAYFALARALVGWIHASHTALPYIVLAAAVVTAILAALYAFQQDDWRSLLSFSSAENAAIAVSLLGASLLFSNAGLHKLAGMAWAAALLHMAGHTLAKSTLFLAADHTYRRTNSYDLNQTGLAARLPWFAAGAWLAGMSLAAIPPTPGFISEWFGFQSLFQGFHLHSLAGRIALALAGAGLALISAIGLATFVKVLGLGLLGRSHAKVAANFQKQKRPILVPVLGLLILTLAIGMPWWLAGLNTSVATRFGATASTLMRHGWILVPLTPHFAFISPTKLAIAIPLYAGIPLLLVTLLARKRSRRVPVWYGGMKEKARDTATTSLTFSNALRRYYSFVYRPRMREDREHIGRPYFVKRLVFTYDLAPVFGPYLFVPLVRLVRWLGQRLRALQSGYLNFYLSLIGMALLIILILVLF